METFHRVFGSGSPAVTSLLTLTLTQPNPQHTYSGALKAPLVVVAIAPWPLPTLPAPAVKSQTCFTRHHQSAAPQPTRPFALHPSAHTSNTLHPRQPAHHANQQALPARPGAKLLSGRRPQSRRFPSVSEQSPCARNCHCAGQSSARL